MRIDGAQVYIRYLEAADADAHWKLRADNRAFLTAWEPRFPDSEFTREASLAFCQRMVAEREQDRVHSFGIFLIESDELIGRIALSNIARGFFQNCTVGYFLAESHNGKGYATEALRLVLHAAFAELGLHRVNANVMPHNIGSIRVVEKVGLRFEGLAKRYLQINGVWEDHNQYAITTEEWNGL